MNKVEYKLFIDRQEEVKKEILRIAELMSTTASAYHSLYRCGVEIEYYKDVIYVGSNDGWSDPNYGSVQIPLDYLEMSDEEITRDLMNKITAIEEAKRLKFKEAVKEKEAAVRIKELALLESLKIKYENN